MATFFLWTVWLWSCRNFLRQSVPKTEGSKELQDGDRKCPNAEVLSPSWKTLHGKEGAKFLCEGIAPDTSLHDTQRSFPLRQFPFRFLPSVGSFCSGSRGYLSNRILSQSDVQESVREEVTQFPSTSITK